MADADTVPDLDAFDTLINLGDDAPADEPAEDLADDPEAEGADFVGDQSDADADEPEDDEPGDEPLSIKDLSEDITVRIKVDGEEVVVSQRELASGYIREKSFNRRVNELRDLRESAEGLIGKANAKVQNYENAAHSLFSNHEKLDEFMLAHHPEQYEKLAFAYARRYAAEKAMPEHERTRLQLDRQAQRHQKQLTNERKRRQALESAKNAETETAQIRDAIERPWREAFAESGSPKLDAAATRRMNADAERIFDAYKAREGRMMPSDDIRHMFATLFRHYAPAAAPEPAAAPKAPRRASRRPRRGKGKAPKFVDGPNGWDFGDSLSD